MIYAFRTNTYARNIYLYGTQKFADIPAAYVEPVKQSAAETFTVAQIDNTLDKSWITQQEYDETMAYAFPAQQ